MSEYQVIDMFNSIQGEGTYQTGLWCTFIRLAGCDIGCEWCDTKESWSKANGIKMTAKEIAEKVTAKAVVITGGEPTLWDLDPLLKELSNFNYYVMLETSGYHALRGERTPQWITVSPKFAVDYQINAQWYDLVAEWKWVVDENFDLKRAVAYEDKSRIISLVSLMPEGSPPKPENINLALEILESVNKLNWHYSPRIQYRIGVK